MSTNIQTCTSITRPTTNLVAGDMRFETDTKNVIIWDGTYWRGYQNDGAGGWSGTNTYSMNFDGVDDYLTMSPVTPTATQGTISAWVKTSDNIAFSVFCWGSSASTATLNGVFRTDMRIRNGKLAYNYQENHVGSGSSEVNGSSTINDGNWHHVAVTSNGSAWSLYVDGSAETLTIQNGTNSGNWVGDLYAVSSSLLDFSNIGALRRDSSLGTSTFYEGNIDEVAVWDSALSASQINNIYNNGTPGNLLPLNPNHWWRMGDGIESGSGSTVYDMALDGNVNATVVNGTSSNTSPAYQADTP